MRIAEQALCVVLEQHVAPSLPYAPFTIDTDTLLCLRLLCRTIDKHFTTQVRPFIHRSVTNWLTWNKFYYEYFNVDTLRLCDYPSSLMHLGSIVLFSRQDNNAVECRLFVARCLYQYARTRKITRLHLKDTKSGGKAVRQYSQQLGQLTREPVDTANRDEAYRAMLDICRPLLATTEEFLLHVRRLTLSMACFARDEGIRGIHSETMQDLIMAYEWVTYTRYALRPYLCTLLSGPLLPLILEDHCGPFYTHARHLLGVGTQLLEQALCEGLRQTTREYLLEPKALAKLFHRHEKLFPGGGADRARVLFTELTRFDQLPVLTARLLCENDTLVVEYCNTRDQFDDMVQTLVMMLLSARRWDPLCHLLDLRCVEATLRRMRRLTDSVLFSTLAICPCKLLPRLASHVPVSVERDMLALWELGTHRLSLWLRYAPRGNLHDSVDHTAQVMLQQFDRQCTIQSWRDWLRIASRVSSVRSCGWPVSTEGHCPCGAPLQQCLTRLAAVLEHLFVPPALSLQIQANQLRTQSLESNYEDEDSSPLGHYDDSEEH